MTRGERGREKVGEGARGVRREKGGASRGRGEEKERQRRSRDCS